MEQWLKFEFWNMIIVTLTLRILMSYIYIWSTYS